MSSMTPFNGYGKKSREKADGARIFVSAIPCDLVTGWISSIQVYYQMIVYYFLGTMLPIYAKGDIHEIIG
jgi:hypothetical protein